MSDKKIQTGIVDFDNLNLAQAANEVKRLGGEEKYSYVITPNIDHLSRLSDINDSSQLGEVYSQASLILCDSRILEKLLRMCNKFVKAVVPGSDLTEYIFKNIITEKDKVLVFGCDEKEMQALYEQYPHLKIQHVNPSMGFIGRPDEVEGLINTVKEANANYIFLAVGSPRQEIFAGKLKRAGLQKGVALCIGASINFITGFERRAPLWMQKMHIEWMYRALQDPIRLGKRYTMNAYCLPRILRCLRQEKSRS